MEMDNRYASAGKGNAALATGIIGTVGTGLGLLGLGNGLWGNNRAAANCDGENTLVTRYELQLQQQLAAKESENALLRANTFSDQKSIEMYKYIDGELKEIRQTLCAQAVHNQKTEDSFALARQDITAVETNLKNQIECEAERRRCADNAIVNYANATFYPKMVAEVTTGTGTTAQTLYNPLSCGKSCCNNNN